MLGHIGILLQFNFDKSTVRYPTEKANIFNMLQLPVEDLPNLLVLAMVLIMSVAFLPSRPTINHLILLDIFSTSPYINFPR